jgi:hypothetical protein
LDTARDYTSDAGEGWDITSSFRYCLVERG